MKRIQGQVRQGDVLIDPTTIPAGAKRIHSQQAIVLAYGEVTGHKHQIVDIERVALYELGDRKFLVIDGEAVEVRHEEHGAVPITKKDNEVIIQEEYRYGASSRVID